MDATGAVPDIRPGRASWSVWLGVHALVVALIATSLPVERDLIAVYFAFFYPVVLGASQSFMLVAITPGSRRAIVAGVCLLGAYLLAAPLLVVVFVVGYMVSGIAIEHQFLTGVVLMVGLPLVGGAVAGLVQWWVLAPRWQFASRLVGAQAVLAPLVSVVAAFVLQTTPATGAAGRPDLLAVRTAFGMLAGGVIAGALAVIILRLSPRR